MAVKFVIDSASDILPDEASELGIVLIPLKVVFGETVYRDAVDLSHRNFFERLIEGDVLPTTCQATPAEFSEVIGKLTANGDQVVVITISSKLSGTYQSALIAAEDFGGKVFVVDSLNATVGERLVLKRGLELARSGLDAKAIAESLDAEKTEIRLIALVDTLEYLKKGGRISPTVAALGGLLSIKPVVAVENGEVVLIGKARGSRRGNNLLRELIEKTGGIDFDKPYCLAYSGLGDELLQKYIEDSADLWQEHTGKLPIATVGSVIGAHVGPGAVAVAFFEKTGGVPA